MKGITCAATIKHLNRKYFEYYYGKKYSLRHFIAFAICNGGDLQAPSSGRANQITPAKS